MVKLCVTTDNGLYPLGHSQALAEQCKALSETWIAAAGVVSVPPSRPISQSSTPGSHQNATANMYAKSDLR